MIGSADSSIEPPLSEVLDDPIVRLVMARDKVSRDDLILMIERHRGHRYQRVDITFERQGE